MSNEPLFCLEENGAKAVTESFSMGSGTRAIRDIGSAQVTLTSFPGRKNERPGTHCMRMRSIPQNLGTPVISVNYSSFSRLENEASLDARLPSMLTKVKVEGGQGYRPGSKPLYVTQRQQTFMAFVYLLRICFRIPI